MLEKAILPPRAVTLHPCFAILLLHLLQAFPTFSGGTLFAVIMIVSAWVVCGTLTHTIINPVVAILFLSSTTLVMCKLARVAAGMTVDEAVMVAGNNLDMDLPKVRIQLAARHVRRDRLTPHLGWIRKRSESRSASILQNDDGQRNERLQPLDTLVP